MDQLKALEEELNWLRGQRDALLKERQEVRELVLKLGTTLNNLFTVFEGTGPAGFSQSTKEEA